MLWQLRIFLVFLVILGLFWSSFGFAEAQEPQNGDFKALKAKVSSLVLPEVEKLKNAIFRVWQVMLDKTKPFLAYVGEIAEKRKDIFKQEYKKEIDEMKGDCVKLFKFVWERFFEKASP